MPWIIVLLLLVAAVPVRAQSTTPASKPLAECQQLVRVVTQTRQMTEESLAQALAVIHAQEQQLKALQAEVAKHTAPPEPKP